MTDTEHRPVEAGEGRQRSVALAKANRRRREISALKADARGGRRDIESLLVDPRAEGLEVLKVLVMVPRCTQRLALDALLACRINGARPCGDLNELERWVLAKAVAEIGSGRAPAPSRGGARPAGRRPYGRPPRVRMGASPLGPPSARARLESDPALSFMVDCLLAAVRLYAERYDGGARARDVVEQWIRFCDHHAHSPRERARRAARTSGRSS